MAARVLGVDGSPDGWVGVALGDGPPCAYAAARVDQLLAAAGDVTHVGIDIPIGLVDNGWRAADLEARKRLGGRRSSLFLTPVRAALEAPDHAAGVAISREASGAGFSIQAWGLRHKVLEVDAVVRDGEHRLREVHPELCFATMAGRPAQHSKKTWAGQQERLALLSVAGIDLDHLGGDTGRAGPDDVVDAAAAAWTARRLADGTARGLPESGSTAIWV